MQEYHARCSEQASVVFTWIQAAQLMWAYCMYRAWLSRQKRTRVCRHQQNLRYKLRAIQSLAFTAAQPTRLLAPFSTTIKSAVFRDTKKKKKKAQWMRSEKSRHRRPGLDMNKKQLLIGFIPIPLTITRKISPLDTYKLLLLRRKQFLTGNLTSCWKRVEHHWWSKTRVE